MGLILLLTNFLVFLFYLLGIDKCKESLHLLFNLIHAEISTFTLGNCPVNVHQTENIDEYYRVLKKNLSEL